MKASPTIPDKNIVHGKRIKDKNDDLINYTLVVVCSIASFLL